MRRDSHGHGEGGRRRGSALVASLLTLMVLASAAGAMVQMHLASLRRQSARLDRWRALYVAEAGLSEGFFAVAQGKSGNVGTADEPATFGDGVFWVEATEDVDGRVELECTGMCGRGRVTLAQVIQRQYNTLSALGMFGDKEIVVEPASVIDGTDSGAGGGGGAMPMEGPGEGSGGSARIGSNADVRLLAGPEGVAEVHGDARPGPTGSALLDPGAVVTGSTMPYASASALPPFEVPDVATDTSTVHGDTRTPLVLGEGAHGYATLAVRPSCKLEVHGPTAVVANQLIVEAGGELAIDTAEGPVAIYVQEGLHLREGAVLSNDTEDATSVFLFTGERTEEGAEGVEFRAGGVFYGQVYAPHATLSVPSTLRVYGAVAARTLVLESGAHLTFDRAMIDSAVGFELLPRLLSWRVVDIPPNAPMGDALARLRMAGVTPTRSADAHREQDFELLYVDASGVVQSYGGSPSAFDWTDLGAVIDVDWLDPVTSAPISVGKSAGLPNQPKLTTAPNPQTEKADPAVIAAIRDTGLSDGQMRDYLLAQSPLAAGELVATLSRTPALSTGSLKKVLVQNSPLPTNVLDLVRSSGSLSAGDLGAVEAAQ